MITRGILRDGLGLSWSIELGGLKKIVERYGVKRAINETLDYVRPSR
ncbi:MAG: hypothetical protein L2C94_000380 [Aigarchaeota archaeon]|nr:hypothetical protein [Candidatus Wolframiiraptor gerlachensis]